MLNVYNIMCTDYIPGSPVRGLEHYGDDDLPTIAEEPSTSELPSEVHCINIITHIHVHVYTCTIHVHVGQLS